MAKKAVVEVQCDRCPRREYVEAATKEPSPLLELKFDGVDISYGDLCTSCKQAVSAHVEGIVKKLEGRSPERKAKKKSQPVANSSSTKLEAIPERTVDVVPAVHRTNATPVHRSGS